MLCRQEFFKDTGKLRANSIDNTNFKSDKQKDTFWKIGQGNPMS